MVAEKALGGFKYEPQVALQSGGLGKGARRASGLVKGIAGKGGRAVNGVVKGVIGGKLTAQGTAALVCYAIMLLAAAFSPVVAAQMELSKVTVVALSGVLLSAALSIYGINCMVVGGCHRLSWAYVAMLVIWTVGVVGGTAFAKYYKAGVAVDVAQPSMLASESPALLLPVGGSDHHPGAPKPATPVMVADGTNRIVETQKANMYEGYDARDKEGGAPGPYVEGEFAALE